MSGEHFLNRERMRVVQRNDRGSVTYRKQYKFGDEVDVSHLDETQVKNLLKSKALVKSKDDLTGWTGHTYPGQVTGAALRQGEDHADIADPGASPEEKGEVDDDDDPEDVDQFSSMDYGQLQDAAKAASPPIPANQSADELRAALRAAQG